MENNKKRSKKFLIPVILIAILILIGFTFKRCSSEKAITANMPAIGDASEGHLPGMSTEEIMSQMQKSADASYFSFKINAEPVFSSPESEGNLEIENPSYNTYPMVVKIYRDDTLEMIYNSGLIPPNYHIQNARLDVVLPSGTYKCTAELLAYNSETAEYLGKSQAGITITIL